MIEEEKEKGIVDITKIVLENQKLESQAIIDYTCLIKDIEDCSAEDFEKETAINIIAEIIADELNHQIKLNELYSFLTDINKKGD